MSRMRISRRKSGDRRAALLERSGELSRQTEYVAARKGLEADSRPLDSDIRPFFESRFGHDFSRVQVHAGGEAAVSAKALDAAAYTVGQDIVFGAEQYAPGTPTGRLLLAHELAHVVQYERAGRVAGERAAVSEQTDTAEAEASDAAVAVAAGGTAHVSVSPAAAVSRGVLDWLEEKAEDVGGAVGGAASDAWDWTADTATSAGGAVADTASAGWDVASGVTAEIGKGIEKHGLLGTIYEGMKENTGYIKQGEEWLSGKIDWLQDEAAGGVQGLADLADGIPVLEDVADAGAWAFDQHTQLSAGAWQGLTTLGGGLLTMAANPVDTARGLYSMAEHAPTVPGVPNPLKMLHGLYDVAVEGEDLGEVANRTLNPLASMQEDAAFWGNVGSAFIEPYKQSIGDDGDYMQAAGRAGFDIASLFIGAGEVNAALRGSGAAGRAAGVIDDAARIATAADDMSRIGVVGDDVGRLGTLGDDVAKAKPKSWEDFLPEARQRVEKVREQYPAGDYMYGMADDPVRGLPEGYGDLLEQPGISITKTPGGKSVPEPFDVGNFAHKYWEDLNDLVGREITSSSPPRGLKAEQPVPAPEFKPSLRTDRKDPSEGVIHELKPESQRRRGEAQAKYYKEKMERNEPVYETPPGGYKTKVHTYNYEMLREWLKKIGFLPE